MSIRSRSRQARKSSSLAASSITTGQAANMTGDKEVEKEISQEESEFAYRRYRDLGQGGRYTSYFYNRARTSSVNCRYIFRLMKGAVCHRSYKSSLRISTQEGCSPVWMFNPVRNLFGTETLEWWHFSTSAEGRHGQEAHQTVPEPPVKPDSLRWFHYMTKRQQHAEKLFFKDFRVKLLSTATCKSIGERKV